MPNTIDVKDAAGSTQTIDTQGTAITGQSLEAGGYGPMGWLSSLKKAVIDRLPGSLGKKTAANSLSVTLSSDEGNLPVSGTVTANLGTIGGAATAAKQPALGTAGTPSADVISVQGVASGTPQPVSGTVTVSGVATQTTLAAVNTATGAQADAEAASGNGSLIALLKRLRTLLSGGLPAALDASGGLKVAVVAGSAAGTEYTEGDTDATISGKAVMWEDTGDTLRPVSSAKPLPVNVVAGGGSGGTSSSFGAAVPATGTAMGISDGTNMVMPSPTNPMPSNVTEQQITPKGVTVASSGDNTAITPTSGKKLRLYYLGVSADAANAASVTFTAKFGAAGATLYSDNLQAGAKWARAIGGGLNYVEGAVDTALVVNLSAAQSCRVNVEYREV